MVEDATGNIAQLSSECSRSDLIIGKPTLKEEVFYGLPGDIVKTSIPIRKQDPAAVLVTILVMFGNVIGCNAYFKVEKTLHYTELRCVDVERQGSIRFASARRLTEDDGTYNYQTEAIA